VKLQIEKKKKEAEKEKRNAEIETEKEMLHFEKQQLDARSVAWRKIEELRKEALLIQEEARA
jgi:hypothetical protein